jgi:hypothetical protein
MERRILICHQPHFFPSMQYLAKMMEADVFVFLDTVDFGYSNWQNRNKWGDGWITIPVIADQTERLI